MEASNYPRTTITTGTNLIKYRIKKMGHLDLRHVTLLGLVKITRKKSKKSKKSSKRKSSQFVMSEAAEVDSADDSNDSEFENEFKEMEELSEDEEVDSQSNIAHDHSYIVAQDQSCIEKYKRQLTAPYKIEMLYAVTFSGKHTRIKNCLPKAIAILSNSKKLFLGHIKILLECLDPKLAELCYVDTDSCFFSMTYPSLQECLLQDKKDEFNYRNIIADESGPLSCHGKMKCEGVFTGAKWRSLKVYRLYNEINVASSQTSHCKGVSTLTASLLPEEMFDVTKQDPLFVTRKSLMPTRTGEILIVKESKQLAIPFNLKRFVCSDTNHTFPFLFVPPQYHE